MDSIKRLDFLSTEAKLTFNARGDIRNKTVIGGGLSLLSLLFSFGLTIYFITEFFSKNNKSVISSSKTSSFLNLTDSNQIPLLFRLTDKMNTPYKNGEKIYKIAMKYWYKAEQSSSSNTYQLTNDVVIEKCNITKHFGKYKKLFMNITDIDTFYCAVPRLYNQTIYGLYGDTNPFGYYHFYIYMCLNQTKGEECLPQSEIENILSNTYLDVRTVDYSIDNSNLESVKVANIRTDRHMLSLSVYKRIWVFLNWVEYSSDNGLFFVDKKKEVFHQVDSFRYDIDLRDITEGTIPGTFTTLTLLSNGKTSVYERKFNKIQEYIATIGGIVNFIFTFAYILNFFISKNTYYLMLMNQSIIEKESMLAKPVKFKTKLGNKITQNNSSMVNNYLEILNNKQGSIKRKTTRNTTCQTNNNSVINKNEEKKTISLKWYRMILPFSVSVHNSKEIKNEYRFISKTLSIFELMRSLIEYGMLRSQRLEETKITISEYLNSSYGNNEALNKTNQNKSSSNFIDKNE